MGNCVGYEELELVDDDIAGCEELKLQSESWLLTNESELLIQSLPLLSILVESVCKNAWNGKNKNKKNNK